MANAEKLGVFNDWDLETRRGHSSRLSTCEIVTFR
jgi:hypothetical protein